MYNNTETFYLACYIVSSARATAPVPAPVPAAPVPQLPLQPPPQAHSAPPQPLHSPPPQPRLAPAPQPAAEKPLPEINSGLDAVKLAATAESYALVRQIVHAFWESETAPEEWEHCLLSILAKKGDLSSAGNYRGIMMREVGDAHDRRLR